jgi:flagellin-like hook-associated protein FlgL
MPLTPIQSSSVVGSALSGNRRGPQTSSKKNARGSIATTVLSLSSDEIHDCVLKQAMDDINEGISLLQLANDGLEEIQSVIDQLYRITDRNVSSMSEEGRQAGSTAGPDMLVGVFKEGLDRIDSIAEETIFQEYHLLNGSVDVVVLSVGIGIHERDRYDLKISDFTSDCVTLGLKKGEEDGTFSSISIGSSASARQAQAALKRAEEGVRLKLEQIKRCHMQLAAAFAEISIEEQRQQVDLDEVESPNIHDALAAHRASDVLNESIRAHKHPEDICDSEDLRSISKDLIE